MSITYRFERGRLWPADDKGAAAVVFNTNDLDAAYRHCRDFRVAVQAGGNCGIWPARMAQRFHTVYTFEPDPVNFRCLCWNAPEENIFKFNAALGVERGTIGMTLRPDNVGAHWVSGSGSIPVLRIDDLELSVCDLIYLDIEGYELPALNGAAKTINRCSPTIAVEDKGMSERYGIAKGEVVRWVCETFGYKAAERFQNDVVMAPCR